MKILLVDDDVLLRDMYATKFTEAGHTVKTAESGESALQVLSEESFDVALLDMVMPGMTGTELLQKLCQQEGGGVAKCVVLSNQGEEEDIAEAKKHGAVGYIVKAEMIPSEVVAKVEELAAT